jgi:guanylate kinase
MIRVETKLEIEQNLKHLKIDCFLDKSLKEYTTWKIGGKADIVAISENADDFEKIVKLSNSKSIKITVLGKGSNVLVPDEGIEGIVIVNKSKNFKIYNEEYNWKKIENNEGNSKLNIKSLDHGSFIDDFLADSKMIVNKAKSLNINYMFSPIKARHKHTDKLSFGDLDDDIVNRGKAKFNIWEFDSGFDLGLAIGVTHKNGFTGLQYFAGIPSTIGGALFNNIHGGSRHFSDSFLLAETLKIVENEPKIILLCGPSGSGKNTLLNHLLHNFPEKYEYISAYTSRKPRENESHHERKFVSREKFEEMIEKKEFIEYVLYHTGDYYGHTYADFEEVVSMGKIALIDVDVLGCMEYKRIFGDDILTIFIDVPNLETIEKRIKSRNPSIKKAELDKRLEGAIFEKSYNHRADYIIKNNELDKTIAEFMNIVSMKSFISRKFLNFKDFNFDYDQSIIRNKANKLLIKKVFLYLAKVEDEQSLEKSKFIAREWALRKKIQPRNSCGSVFQSLPEELANKNGFPSQAAAYIIDQKLHMKGFKIGGAKIPDIHANFIINESGEAKSKDIKAIVEEVKKRAKNELNIELEEEFDYL